MEIDGGDLTEVDHALDRLSTALDHLVKVVEDGGLDGYDDLGMVDFLRRFERVRNRTALVDHRAIRDAEARRLPDRLTQPAMTGVLVWALRLSPGGAARRVQAAEQLGERVAMTGEPLTPLRPTLAAVQRDGDATPEQIDICVRAIARVDHRGFDSADLDRADELLAQFARSFPPKELRRLAQQVVDHIDPDGSQPQDAMNADRRHLAFRQTRDGAWTVEGRLTGALGAKLDAILCPLAAPRSGKVTLEDGREVDEPDQRHHGQRIHDALEEVCDRLLRSGTLPDSGGTPASVIVRIDEGDLAAQRRWGVTSDGTALSAEDVRDLADEADVYPSVISSTGVVLRMGRTRRLATPGQTMALFARDGGCTFPGCQRPPEGCERHHVVAWADGGLTDLHNLCLLCSYHHHSFASRGWTCRMIDDLPAWVPPRWIDREQRPLLNARISASSVRGRLRR